jgi:hypothetical protein
MSAGTTTLSGLVVPDFDLHTSVQGSSLGRGIRCDRLGGAGPFEGDGLRRQRQRRLDELGHLSGAFPGEPGVVAVDPGQRVRQRLVVGVAHQVQSHVLEVPHAPENALELQDRARGNVRDSGLEPDRRNDVPELDRLHGVGKHLALLQPVPGCPVEQLRIVDPLPERHVARQMLLDGLAGCRLHHVRSLDSGGAESDADH